MPISPTASGVVSAAHSASNPSLDATIAVETPEQVMLTYTLAGFGSRALAAMLDMIILVVLMIVIGILFVAVGVTKGTVATAGAWAAAIMILLEFAIFWGYFVAFEALNDGQTPGKMLLKLRVVRDGGYAVTFAASAVRNLGRIVDMQPGFTYVFGALSVLITKSGKRLGDLLAGTFVVHEGNATYDYAALPKPTATESAVTPLLRDDEYDMLERYVARRADLTPERRRVLSGQVAERLVGRLDPSVPQGKALLDLFNRERAARASSVAGRSDTGTQREQHAIIALGVARWNEFAALLAEVRRQGLRVMRPTEVSDFVERYRQISTDLARLQTASRGRTFDALFFVSRLVAGGHAVLYRRRVRGTATAVRYLAVEVPREIRRSAAPIALAALLFFGPAIASYTVAVQKPETIPRFVPPTMIERADEGKARIRRHEGYVTIPEPERPIDASLIITNNIQICLMAFAFGLTAGLGTILILVSNGVMLGSGMGVFQVKGVAELLWAFVAPHGVLELSAICISGGAGLLIGSAIVLPGQMTRREAMIVRGRRAIKLLSATALFLLVAGTIEGLISPRVWPLSWKFAVSFVTAVAMISYIMLGRRATSTEAMLERGTVF